jgi:hypothetical protein
MAATTDPVVVARVGPVIWIARLRTDRVAIFRASVSKTSNAVVVVVLPVSVAGTASEGAVAAALAVVTALEGAVEDLAAVIALGVEHSVAVVALADSAAEAGAGGNNLGLGFAFNFSYNQKTQSTYSNKNI